MKKFYVLTVVCIGLCIQGFGQTFTWVGPSNGDWNATANWSISGSSDPFPNNSTHNVIFNGSATVNLNTPVETSTVHLNSLSILGTNSDVRITSTGTEHNLTIHSANVGSPALRVNAGNILRLAGSGSVLILEIVDNAKGTIDGTLSLEGIDPDQRAVMFFSSETVNPTTKVNVNSGGRIIVEANGQSPVGSTLDNLSFNAGSKLEIKNDQPNIPAADYALSSEIIITGVTNESVLTDIGAGQTIGNVTYNCPNQVAISQPLKLNFNSGTIIGGDLKIINTNNNPLVIMSNETTVSGLVIKGDLDIQGTSDVTLADAVDNNQTYTITVEGDIVANGTTFKLQRRNNNGVQPTTLIVKGDILHTNGSFTQGSTAINESLNLFVIEMNGGGAQTINSAQQTFDIGTKQLTLKINNSGSGVTLQSPLTVGRLNLTAGKLNTTLTNHLTINNTSGQSIVLTSSPGSFVDGPVRRVVASTNELVFPTGNGSIKRPISVIPTSNTSTTFQARYINAGSGNNSFAAPLDGIEQNYYWDVQRIGAGADAQVRLTLNGAISGADAGDAIVPVRFDGANWVRQRGPVDGFIAPGDATTGFAQTDNQVSFGSYTFGYGVQASVLPINLESFNAKKVNSSTQLNWKISENSNPVSFEVMKSADGINFGKIGIVSAFEGKLNYDFIDNSLLAGNNYYRLKMLDKDGKISFSSIVVVMNGTKGVMISSMIPTMVIDRARLNITSSVKGNMQLVVTDISGRIIQNQNVSIDSGNQQVWLNASRLSSGIYQVTGYINGEKTATMRFFKR